MPHLPEQRPQSPRPAPGAGGEMRFRGVRARTPVECVALPAEADRVAAGGLWAVVGDFEGRVRAWRFADVVRDDDVVRDADVDRDDAAQTDPDPGPWPGPDAGAWESSLTAGAYRAGVEEVRRRIRQGEIYQANLCRVLSAPLVGGPTGEPPAAALAAVLAAGNPAPFGGFLHVPAASGLDPVWLVSASPELFLRIADGQVTSAPIKGTAPEPGGLTGKDRAENIMIADVVRNDLQAVCRPGTVDVTGLLEVEHHPGLVHLVTTVRGDLLADPPDWSALLAATFPPASVSGAPKLAARAAIARLEPVARGPYCGMVGWIDSDRRRAELAVAIRTFWWDGSHLRFGTGAGITGDSDPAAEWAETELKATRLVALASTGGTP